MYTPDIFKSKFCVWGGRDILKMDCGLGGFCKLYFVGYVLCRPYSALIISVEELGAMAKNNLIKRLP